MKKRRKSSGDPRRRRRYRFFRFTFILRHALKDEATHWHIAAPIILALLSSIFIEKMHAMLGWPMELWLVPILAAVAYVAWIVRRRYRRVARRFKQLRQREREWRHLSLRLGGGVTLARFNRLTWLRVTLPFYAVLLIGIVVAVRLFPKRNDPGGVVTAIATGLIAMGAFHLLTRWNEQQRPRDLHLLCPRCGYNLSGSPQRCPECGLARFVRRSPTDD